MDAGAYAQYAFNEERHLAPGESINAGGLKNVFADERGRLAFGPNDEPFSMTNSGIWVVGVTFQFRFGESGRDG